jgi:hypothetical protein
MGSSLLLGVALLLAPQPTSTSLGPGNAERCLCNQSEPVEPCGPERTTCHCVESPGWTRVRFWSSDVSRCEELVFFLIDADPREAPLR